MKFFIGLIIVVLGLALMSFLGSFIGGLVMGVLIMRINIIIENANILKEKGQYNAAILLYSQALSLRKNLLIILKFAPNDYHCKKKNEYITEDSAIYCNLGFCHQGNSDNDKALLCFEEAFRKIQSQEIFTSIEIESNKSNLHMVTLYKIAEINESAGKLGVARKKLKDLLLYIKAVFGEQTEYYANILQKLASLDKEMGRLSVARDELEKALLIIKNILGEQTETYAITLNNLSQLKHEMGELKPAKIGYKQVLIILKNTVGEQSLSYASTLNNLGRLNLEIGELEQSKDDLEKALFIKKNMIGEKDQSYASTLLNLAMLDEKTGKLNLALEKSEQAVFIFKNTVGEYHSLYASALNSLAILNHQIGQLEKARDIYQQVSVITKNTIGEQSQYYALNLQSIARLDEDMGKTEEARKKYEQALLILKNTVGEESQFYVEALNSLAGLNLDIGQIEKAQNTYEQALLINDSIDKGKSTLTYVNTLDGLAQVNHKKGILDIAKKQFEDVLMIKKSTFGEQTQSYATTLQNLAKVNQQMGKLELAKEQIQQALLILNNTIRKPSKEYATTLNSLGVLYRQMGKLNLAKKTYEQALLIIGNTVGKQTESYANILSNIARLNVGLGRKEEAEKNYQQALLIIKDTFGEESPSYAKTLQSLATLYKEMGYQKIGGFDVARNIYEQVLLIFKNTIGEFTPDYAMTLSNLALLNKDIGNLETAKEQYEQALLIHRNTVGEQAESYSCTLQNLAVLNQEMGQFIEAREGYKQSLLITKNTIGEQTESYANTLQNLAGLEICCNAPLKALTLFREIETIQLKITEQVFLVSSDHQRLDYLQQNYYHLEAFLSFVLEYLPHHQEAVLFAYDYVLRRKAIASETALKQHLQLLSGAYPHLADKLEEKRQIAEQITFLRLQDTPLTNKLAYIEELEREKQKIEAELSQEIDFPLASELKKADHRAVALELPTGSTLLEFVRFRVYDFQKNQSHEARYLAFILPAGQPDNITMIDLGETESIDRLIEIFRENVEDSRKYKQQNKNKTVKDTLEEQKQQSQANKQEIEAKKRGLKYLIFDKIQPYLTPEIFIAPDSFLNLLPFEILPNDKNGYLMDDYNFNYLSVGRDLLRFKLPSPIPLTTPIIIANPDYNLTLHSAQNPTLQPENWDSPPELLSQLRETMPDQAFSSLPGTVIEAEKIAPLLGVTPISDRHALKTAISKHSRTPKILHIATHGFYQSDIPKPDRNPTDKTPFILADAEINPLRRSGLAFAGVNTFIQGGQLPSEAEDGILTADDITYLNLLGTELVVTSACQTALGKIESGETITGFRRSFIQAGAKTLIVSLWSVPDLATAILMQHFYYYLLQEKRTKADSLKQAKRDICNITIGQMRQEWLTEKAINKVENHSPEMANQLRNLSQKHDHERPYEHPKNWAAFICLGNPSAIAT